MIQPFDSPFIVREGAVQDTFDIHAGNVIRVPDSILPPTREQSLILRFITDYILQHGVSPTVRETMTGCGWHSTNTVKKHIDALISKGYLLKETCPSGTRRNRGLVLAHNARQIPPGSLDRLYEELTHLRYNIATIKKMAGAEEELKALPLQGHYLHAIMVYCDSALERIAAIVENTGCLRVPGLADREASALRIMAQHQQPSNSNQEGS